MSTAALAADRPARPARPPSGPSRMPPWSSGSLRPRDEAARSPSCWTDTPRSSGACAGAGDQPGRPGGHLPGRVRRPGSPGRVGRSTGRSGSVAVRGGEPGRGQGRHRATARPVVEVLDTRVSGIDRGRGNPPEKCTGRWTKIARLPDRLQAVVVLCGLEGRTRDESGGRPRVFPGGRQVPAGAGTAETRTRPAAAARWNCRWRGWQSGSGPAGSKPRSESGWRRRPSVQPRRVWRPLAVAAVPVMSRLMTARAATVAVGVVAAVIGVRGCWGWHSAGPGANTGRRSRPARGEGRQTADRRRRRPAAGGRLAAARHHPVPAPGVWPGAWPCHRTSRPFSPSEMKGCTLPGRGDGRRNGGTSAKTTCLTFNIYVGENHVAFLPDGRRRHPGKKRRLPVVGCEDRDGRIEEDRRCQGRGTRSIPWRFPRRETARTLPGRRRQVCDPSGDRDRPRPDRPGRLPAQAGRGPAAWRGTHWPPAVRPGRTR